ncbi:superinfection immunity protein [Polaribacter sp.]|uniref:superinfection immunity protein n=1 Tax=Polaribacter sp. TaxID=1920175 RepID=UPI003F4C78B7
MNSILALNIFLGWSIICWIVALVWALSKDNQVLTIEKKTNNEDVNQLIELRKLLEDGYITSIEFEKQKNKIINQ